MAKSIPLVLLLLIQVVLVAGVFAALIASTTLFMEQQMRSLVESRLEAGLASVRAKVLLPMLEYEHMIFGMRDRMRASPAEYQCSDSDISYAASRPFLRDALSAVYRDPLIAYYYQLGWSTTHLRPTAGPGESPYYHYECDGQRLGLYTFSNGSYWASYDTVDPNIGLGNMTNIPHEEDAYDNTAETYVLKVLGIRGPEWIPTVYASEAAGTVTLFGFYVRVETDPISGNTTRAIGVDVNMTHFRSILSAVTPVTSDAHTSLYDMRLGKLLSTTSANTPLFTNGSSLWPAGSSADGALNSAFREAVDHGAGDAASSDGAGKVFETTNGGDRIISFVRIRSPTSGIDMLAVQAMPRSFYFGPLDRLRAGLIGSGVAAAVLVALVCVAVTLAVRRPLQVIGEQMALAAIMRNDEVDMRSNDLAGPILTEMAALRAAFLEMNSKLLYARAFMPQSMLFVPGDSDDVTEGDLDEGDDGPGGRYSESEGGFTTLTGGPPEDTSSNADGAVAGGKIQGTHNALTHHSHSSDACSVASGFSRGGGGTGGAPGAGGRVMGPKTVAGSPSAIVRRGVAVLVLNVRGFHHLLDLRLPALCAGPAVGLLERLQPLLDACRGVVDSYHGDHFVITFNAARAAAQPARKACAFAIATENALFGTPYERLTMGASHGAACIGQIGTQTLRRFSVLSPAYSAAMSLERTAHALDSALAASTRFKSAVMEGVGGHSCTAPPQRSTGAHGLAAHPHASLGCVLAGNTAAEVRHDFMLTHLGAVELQTEAPAFPTSLGLQKSDPPRRPSEAAERHTRPAPHHGDPLNDEQGSSATTPLVGITDGCYNGSTSTINTSDTLPTLGHEAAPRRVSVRSGPQNGQGERASASRHRLLFAVAGTMADQRGGTDGHANGEGEEWMYALQAHHQRSAASGHLSPLARALEEANNVVDRHVTEHQRSRSVVSVSGGAEGYGSAPEMTLSERADLLARLRRALDALGPCHCSVCEKNNNDNNHKRISIIAPPPPASAAAADGKAITQPPTGTSAVNNLSTTLQDAQQSCWWPLRVGDAVRRAVDLLCGEVD